MAALKGRRCGKAKGKIALGNAWHDFTCHGHGLHQTALWAALRGSRSALALAFTAWDGDTTAKAAKGKNGF